MAVSQAIQEEVLKEAYSATPNYDIDYNDPRFGKVESDKSQALTDIENTYGGMIGSAQKYFDDQIQATKDWEDKQIQLQKDQTDFAITQIQQQKDQANKDYKKEQSGAYVDWQKQSNQYGVNAEKMASSGLTNTGYSESSQVSMYNTYQNRVATAREVYNRAVLNYDNAIKDAILQNNAALAEIAYQSLQQQLELSLQGFQYKNQLLIEQSNKELEIKNMYHNQWMDALGQINTENALAEDIRQYNETMKWNTEQAELNRQHDIKLKEVQHDYDVKMAEIEQNYKIAYLNAQTEKEKEILKVQHENDIKKLNQQLANEKALLKYELDLKKSSVGITGYSGSGNSSRGSLGSKFTNYLKNNVAVNGSKTTTSNPTVNTKSKLSLGSGPISDAEAARRVNNGTATATVVNGQVYLTPAVSLPTSKLPKTSITTKKSALDNNPTKKTQPYRFRGL